MPRAFGYALTVPDRTLPDGWGLAGQDVTIKRHYDENLAPRGIQWGELIVDPPAARKKHRFLARDGAIVISMYTRPGDYVIFHSPVRAFRNGRDLLATYERWKAKGVFMSIISTGVDTSNPSQAELLEGSLRYFDFSCRLDSDGKAERTKAEQHLRRSMGRRWSMNPPHGFKLKKRDDGHVGVVPDEHVRWLMLLVAQRLAAGQQIEDIYKHICRCRFPRYRLEIPPKKPGELHSKDFRYVKHESGWEVATLLNQQKAWRVIC
jgi:hypothetical protein